MRLNCPFCGERDLSEFSCRGEAVKNPPFSGDAGDVFATVYLRDNAAGEHDEYWYHASGCRGWLLVSRDTRTHEVRRVGFAAEARG